MAILCYSDMSDFLLLFFFSPIFPSFKANVLQCKGNMPCSFKKEVLDSISQVDPSQTQHLEAVHQPAFHHHQPPGSFRLLAQPSACRWYTPKGISSSSPLLWPRPGLQTLTHMFKNMYWTKTLPGTGNPEPIMSRKNIDIRSVQAGAVSSNTAKRPLGIEKGRWEHGEEESLHPRMQGGPTRELTLGQGHGMRGRPWGRRRFKAMAFILGLH